jgi:hypothetical protein
VKPHQKVSLDRLEKLVILVHLEEWVHLELWEHKDRQAKLEVKKV